MPTQNSIYAALLCQGSCVCMYITIFSTPRLDRYIGATCSHFALSLSGTAQPMVIRTVIWNIFYAGCPPITVLLICPSSGSVLSIDARRPRPGFESGGPRVQYERNIYNRWFNLRTYTYVSYETRLQTFGVDSSSTINPTLDAKTDFSQIELSQALEAEVVTLGPDKLNVRDFA